MEPSIFDDVAAGTASNIEELLARGADVNATLEDETTLLHCAVIAGDIKTAKLLIDRGIDISTENKWGITALQLAEMLHKQDVVDFLVEATPASEEKMPTQFTLPQVIFFTLVGSSFLMLLKELFFL